MRRAALVVLALSLVACPKKHKPPAMDRIWLGPKDGCAHLRTGEIACWGADFDATPTTTQAFGRDVRELALGERYLCALHASGKVHCLEGDKMQDLRLDPAKAVASGGTRACAITTAGEVRCWSNDAERAAPVKLELPGPAKAIAMGPELTCVAVEQPKVVRCTGRGSTNDDLLAGEDVTQLTAGRGHACALLANGGVRCWGADVNGQVGEGNRDVKHYPPEAAKVGPSAEVRAGSNHTCARLRDNTVVCWGDNKHHQMADGTTDSRLEPVRIQGLYSVTELAAAGDATCAVMSLDHSVRCWGANGSGQLGDGTAEEHTVPMPLRWAAASK